MNILLKAICSDDFPTRPNARAYKEYTEKRQKKARDARGKETVSTRPRTSFDFLDDPDDHWVIVDSGANRNYIARRDLLSRCEAIAAKIAGVGDLATTATLQDLFTGMMFDRKLQEIPFDSFGMHIPKAK
eukprot:142383-Rhodomonas_salina.1